MTTPKERHDRAILGLLHEITSDYRQKALDGRDAGRIFQRAVDNMYATGDALLEGKDIAAVNRLLNAQLLARGYANELELYGGDQQILREVEALHTNFLRKIEDEVSSYRDGLEAMMKGRRSETEPEDYHGE